MSTFQGRKAILSLGGIITVGSVETRAVAQGETSATFDSVAPPTRGVILPGDKFTVAGDAQVYEVTQADGPFGAVLADQVVLTFTPGVQLAGGWPLNALVTFVTNKVIEARDWRIQPTRDVIDRDVLGDLTKRKEVGQQDFTGSATAWFDYDDDVQKKFVDDILADNPQRIGFVGVMANGKHLYADGAFVDDIEVVTERGPLVQASLSIQGSHNPDAFSDSTYRGLLLDWN